MLKKISVVILILFLSACGNTKDNSNNKNSASNNLTPTDVNTVFSLSSSDSFIEGTVNSTTYTGSDNFGGKYTAVYTTRVEAPTSFLGYPAIALLTQFQMTETTTGAIGSDIITSYYTTSQTDRRFLGNNSSTATTVSVEPVAMPQTAKIGDFGIVGTYINDQGETEKKSWRLDNAGNGNATLVTLSTTRDQSGTIISSSTSSIVIDENGNTISEKIVIYLAKENGTITLISN